MQLLVLLLALLASNGGIELIKPVLESVGGESVGKAIKQAEELCGLISAVRTVAEPPRPQPNQRAGGNEVHAPSSDFGGFPLAPVSNIADEAITYALSRYIATGK